MLILSRRIGETILIDAGIKIVVLECARNGVRLGIEAPQDVTILRGELMHPLADETNCNTSVSDTQI
jgi:carbon storage regulator